MLKFKIAICTVIRDYQKYRIKREREREREREKGLCKAIERKKEKKRIINGWQTFKPGIA